MYMCGNANDGAGKNVNTNEYTLEVLPIGINCQLTIRTSNFLKLKNSLHLCCDLNPNFLFMRPELYHKTTLVGECEGC